MIPRRLLNFLKMKLLHLPEFLIFTTSVGMNGLGAERFVVFCVYFPLCISDFVDQTKCK